MSNNKMPNAMEEAYEPDKAQQRKWSEFIETVCVDFFQGNKIEKMSIEDGNGNKAKLAMTKDGGIKLEYSTQRIL